MEAETTLAVHPVLAVTILTAIPVVAFALWAEYFGQFTEKLREIEGKDHDRAVQLRRVRWAGIYAFLLQAAVYLSTAPMRQAHPLACLAVFALALIAQTRTQAVLEMKIRGSAPMPGEDPARTQSASQQTAIILKALLWTTASLIFYFSLIWGSLYAAHFLLKGAPLAKETALWLLAGAGVAGVFTATALLLGLTPFHLRKTLPVQKLEDGELRTGIEACFTRNGFRAPELWVIEFDEYRFTNAMISGFRNGRGFFRPGLFLSRSLLRKLNRDEVEAVVLHELSHWSLNHMRRRFFHALGAIALSTIGLSAGFIVGQLFLPPASQALLRIATTLGAIVIPFLLVRQQTEKHEFEADLHCVLTLEADLESYAQALRKIDVLNCQLSGEKDPLARLSPGGGHPSTENRILALRKAWDQARAGEVAEPAREDRAA